MKKSTYFAARYIIDGHALTDQYIEKYGKKMNKLVEMDLLNKIADPGDVEQIYALGRQLQAKESKISQQRTKQRKKITERFCCPS